MALIESQSNAINLACASYAIREGLANTMKVDYLISPLGGNHSNLQLTIDLRELVDG
jgi:hypothetical protein